LPSATVFLMKNISEFTCPKGRTLADYVSSNTKRNAMIGGTVMSAAFLNNYSLDYFLAPLRDW
jgi:hypothetical protein